MRCCISRLLILNCSSNSFWWPNTGIFLSSSGNSCPSIPDETFLQARFILSPISVTAVPIRIVQLTTFLPLEPDWLNLPANWLSPDPNALCSTQAFLISLYVTLRVQIVAGSDGDGIHDSEISHSPEFLEQKCSKIIFF